MKCATILPTAYLYLTKDDEYHMALAHLVGKDQKYTEFYKGIGYDTSKYLILDNGVIEGNPRPIDELCEKAMLLMAQEIILPDAYMDMDKTLELSCEALQFAREHTSLKVMVVPQGETFDDWVYCAEQMIEWDIDTLGIPKNLVKIAGRDGRLEALKALGNKVRGLDIHLLGCWESPLEVMMVKRAVKNKDIKPVRGVDSAIAYVYTREGLLLNQAARPSGAIDFGAKDADVDVLKKNIEIWKDACVIPDDSKVTKLFY
jgi:hypothetical protein